MKGLKAWPRLAAPLAAYKVLTALFVLYSNRLLPPLFDLAAYRGNFHWPAEETLSASIQFKTWDAQHYLFLSRFGYAPGSESNRFFPLWPLAVRAGAFLVRSHLVSALLLTNLLSLAALLLFHDYCARRRGEGSADAALLLLLAYPGSLFFGFPYSESLFVLLAVAFLAALDLKRWRWVALTAFLLPLTRSVGVAAAAPLVYQAYVHWRRDGRVPRPLLLCLAAPFLGVAAYLLFMRAATGDAFFFFASWSSQNLIVDAHLSKLLDVPGFLRAFAGAASFHDPLDSAVDRVFFVGFVLACVRLWKTDKTLLAFALPLGLIPAMTVSFCGYTRYLLGAVPVFLAAGDWFAASQKRRAWLWLTASALFAVQVVFLFRHINYYWVG
ncbi:MAG: mannosyltransferase family protein [Elusimicrobiota bacterium]